MKTNLNIAYFSLLILALTINFDYSEREILFILSFWLDNSQFSVHHKNYKKASKNLFPYFS